MHLLLLPLIQGYHCGSDGKESSCNAGNLGSTPGLGRSPGEGQGYPLQYSGLENSMDCIGHGVAKSPTRLSDFHFPLIQEKESETVSRSVVSDSCNRMGCSPPGSSVHRDSPGKNTGVGCHSLLQGSFPTQGLNLGLLHCRQILYHLRHQESSGQGRDDMDFVLAFTKKYVFKTWVQFPARCYEVRWNTHGSIELAAAAAKVLQLCPTRDSMESSPPGSSAHGIL